jgi:hypothetical protein
MVLSPRANLEVTEIIGELSDSITECTSSSDGSAPIGDCTPLRGPESTPLRGERAQFAGSHEARQDESGNSLVGIVTPTDIQIVGQSLDESVRVADDADGTPADVQMLGQSIDESIRDTGSSRSTESFSIDGASVVRKAIDAGLEDGEEDAVTEDIHERPIHDRAEGMSREICTEVSADVPKLAEFCDCGNKFLADALFCRKCGCQRREQPDKEDHIEQRASPPSMRQLGQSFLAESEASLCSRDASLLVADVLAMYGGCDSASNVSESDIGLSPKMQSIQSLQQEAQSAEEQARRQVTETVEEQTHHDADAGSGPPLHEFHMCSGEKAPCIVDHHVSQTSQTPVEDVVESVSPNMMQDRKCLKRQSAQVEHIVRILQRCKN